MSQERSEAIDLAKHAGIRDHEWLQDQYGAIERLVKLAKEAAREECAVIAENFSTRDGYEIAHKIRSRSNVN